MFEGNEWLRDKMILAINGVKRIAEIFHKKKLDVEK